MRSIHKTIAAGLLLGGVAVLSGCSTTPERLEDFNYEPAYPANMGQVPAPVNGSLYSSANAVTFFNDARAHRVGDIITIELVEKFNANRRDQANFNRNNNMDLGVSTPLNVLGRSANEIYDGLGTGGVGFGSSSNFSGNANAQQDSTVSGSVAVTVVEVIPNGNLVVRGEKWITVGSSEEVIRFGGIVRPQDISPDNTIESTKVADVRLIYRDTGVAGNTTRPGPVTRFLTKFWPL
ncbi:flagellar basal body L-ring protein FlgH [Thiomicrospira sp. ALE5]|uniref:flagellar basal body L-ring protein FlgH n=1 Tax=Thiomicrospira sp. ALE5 TaxID=748650 RepID=UPI0008E2E778|nr:flagellar basal body L-ring protein FlgH [Thiomicrospira sp. ALE5]SFR59521.1 flagellar L-ring protein precursor FlgH [Thiomicrospira sp. ALE5]